MTDSDGQDGPRPWEERYRPREHLTAAEYRTIVVAVLGNLATIVAVAAAVLVARNTSVQGALIVMATCVVVMRGVIAQPIDAWFRRKGGARGCGSLSSSWPTRCSWLARSHSWAGPWASASSGSSC